jgi:cysteine desulfurase
MAPHSTYLDHASTTPLRPEARAALDSHLDAANASSAHLPGQDARAALEEAREQVATELGCAPAEVVFTSGATEANNLAVKGVLWAAREQGRSHLVISAVEHPAVAEPARWLAERGEARLTVVPPAPDGRVEVERVLAAVEPDTALVSVMAANNEVGAVNDIAALGAALADTPVALHCDAVQAVSTRRVDVAVWGVDALSLSAHKLGGPQGVGVAVLRRELPVTPLTHGGGQDRGVRSGTFAVGLDVACAAALRAAAADRADLDARLQALSQRLADGATQLEGVHRNGPAEAAWRLSSHVHLSLEAADPDALRLELDRAGVAASTGSACASGAGHASPVVEACGITGTPLRLSLGWTSTDQDVDRALDVLADVVPRVRLRLSLS